MIPSPPLRAQQPAPTGQDGYRHYERILDYFKYLERPHGTSSTTWEL